MEQSEIDNKSDEGKIQVHYTFKANADSEIEKESESDNKVKDDNDYKSDITDEMNTFSSEEDNSVSIQNSFFFNGSGSDDENKVDRDLEIENEGPSFVNTTSSASIPPTNCFVTIQQNENDTNNRRSFNSIYDSNDGVSNGTICKCKKTDAHDLNNSTSTYVNNDSNMQEYRIKSLVCYSDSGSDSEESETSSESEPGAVLFSGSEIDEENGGIDNLDWSTTDDDDDHTEMENRKKTRHKMEFDSKMRLRTDGEVFPEELPPLEYLSISVGEDIKLEPVGTISGIVDVLVVIESVENSPALHDDTVLFLENRSPLGLVFETLGTVEKPFYAVRFNSNQDIVNRNINIGDKVMYAPNASNLTKFVFISKLRKMTANDASWVDDNEAPIEEREYSDDEEEKRAKHQLDWIRKRQEKAERIKAWKAKRAERIEAEMGKGVVTSENPPASNDGGDGDDDDDDDDKLQKRRAEKAEWIKAQMTNGVVTSKKPFTLNDDDKPPKRKRRSLKRTNRADANATKPVENRSGLPQGSMNRNPFAFTPSYTAQTGHKTASRHRAGLANRCNSTKPIQAQRTSTSNNVTTPSSNLMFGGKPAWQNQQRLAWPPPTSMSTAAPVNPFSIIAPPSFLPPPPLNFLPPPPSPSFQPGTGSAIGAAPPPVAAGIPPRPPTPTPVSHPSPFVTTFDSSKPPPPFTPVPGLFTFTAQPSCNVPPPPINPPSNTMSISRPPPPVISPFSIPPPPLFSSFNNHPPK